MTVSVGIAIITHSAKKHLPFCLPPLLETTLNPRILVVNSSSNDGTVELAQEMGVETLIVPRVDFNHGSTREMARQQLKTDIVMMLTPDAYFQNAVGVEALVKPLIEKKAAVAYARQIPHNEADFFESFPREFNYPGESHIRSLQDIQKFGIYTFFCSNSCAAYCNAALDKIGGFESVLLGEDTLAVIKLLQSGHQIAYVSEAVVAHSHRYSLKQEFERHFDTGLARKALKSHFDQAAAGSDQARGKAYVKEMFARLKSQPLLFPYALLHVLTKWLGYRLGSLSQNAPVWFKKFFSSQDFYWVSRDFLGTKELSGR
jgi:rhamnosyltransferase